jgi:hypothetical protein
LPIERARVDDEELVQDLESRWTPRTIAWLQGGIIALLTVLSVVEQYIIHILGRDDLEDFLITFDLDAESNLPTWYSAIALLACAVLLGRIATLTRRAHGRFAGHWRALGAIFVVLSLDEIARLHEHLGRLQSVWHTHGLFYFAWVIPGAIVVLCLAVVFARFVLHLPPATRWRFLGAAVVFVTGALGVEAIGGWRAETMGMNNMTHSFIATIEEVLELAGVAWFLVALLQHRDAMAAPASPGEARRKAEEREAA